MYKYIVEDTCNDLFELTFVTFLSFYWLQTYDSVKLPSICDTAFSRKQHMGSMCDKEQVALIFVENNGIAVP